MALKVEADAQTHDLLAVDRQTNSLLVSGHINATPGSIVLLDHAGQRVSPYNVVSSAPEGDNTRVTVAEDPGFSWDAEKKTATFEYLPRISYTGPHTLSLAPVAHLSAD